ncbi:hypothetical protein D3C75_793870 [compost metagenome]
MIRALTTEEKALSQAAKKRANKALDIDRKKLGGTFWDQHYRMAKGNPVFVRLTSEEIVLDYDLLRGMVRRLKGRRIEMRILKPYLPSGPFALALYHSDPWSCAKGEIELFQIPDYQRMHLTDIPVIELDFD